MLPKLFLEHTCFFSSYIHLSTNFGINVVSFQIATAFVLNEIIKDVQESQNANSLHDNTGETQL